MAASVLSASPIKVGDKLPLGKVKESGPTPDDAFELSSVKGKIIIVRSRFATYLFVLKKLADLDLACINTVGCARGVLANLQQPGPGLHQGL